MYVMYETRSERLGHTGQNVSSSHTQKPQWVLVNIYSDNTLYQKWYWIIFAWWYKKYLKWQVFALANTAKFKSTRNTCNGKYLHWQILPSLGEYQEWQLCRREVEAIGVKTSCKSSKYSHGRLPVVVQEILVIKVFTWQYKKYL